MAIKNKLLWFGKGMNMINGGGGPHSWLWSHVRT